MPSLDKKESVILQDRDLLFLRGLFECRVMTTVHAAAIYFTGRIEMARKRLQKLKSAGFIGERKRLVNEPAVLFITRQGLETLRAQGILAEYPEFDVPVLEKRARVSTATIRHELEVMDVKAAFHAALVGSPTLSVAEFTTWPRLNEFVGFRRDGSEIMVRPDGFIRIREKDSADGKPFEHTFFLEVDRSTETQEILVSRANSYRHHYRSGGFAEKNGAPRSAFKDYPFRVLMVFKSAERRNNTAERLLQNNPPISSHSYLATIEDVTANPFGAIWMCPRDYRDALANTSFAPSDRRSQEAYKRQTPRDVLVEQNTKKRDLLSD